MRARALPGWTAVACGIAAVALAAGVARAQSAAPDDDASGNRRSAAQAYDRGTAQYLRGDFAGAADWFEAADRLVPSTLALASAIRAHRAVATPPHLARAATLALRVLARPGDDAQATQSAQRAIDQLAPTLARITVHCDHCDVDVDGELQSSMDVFVVPGSHRVVAHWSQNRGGDRTLDVAAGAVQDVSFAMPDAPANTIAAPSPNTNATTSASTAGSPTAEPTSTRGLPPPVFIAAAVLTLASGAVAAGAWGVATSDGSQLIAGAMATHTRNVALEQQTNTFELLTDGFLTGAIVFGAVAIGTLFFTRWHRTTEAAPIVVSPSFGSNGFGGLGVSGRF